MIPEGMTAEKLREIAAWLDTLDLVAQEHIRTLRAHPEVPRSAAANEVVNDQAAYEAVLGKEVQDDLRRWADELEINDQDR